MGVYVGNSFGIALVLAFIEALLKHYNSSIIVNINGCIAVTGGIDKNSKIISTGKTTIESKVETVFYSDAHIFCVPKTDEMWAEEKLLEFKKEYPNRNLKIVGLTDLDDLLSRRNVVDIRKQKLIIRSAKFVKKNWITAAAIFVLAILLTYLFVLDFDDNPTSLTTDGNILYVKNKNGKVLWTKNIDVGKKEIDNQKILEIFFRIFDIDSDGNNEVLIANEVNSKIGRNKSRGELRCYNKYNEKVWSYYFADSVSSKREILEPYYAMLIIDTLTFNNQKSLFLISTNSASYSSAIYRIDLRAGERLPGTIWCSGHTVEALIKDTNNDNKKDILAVGLDNGFEEQVVFAFTIDTLTQVRPSIDDYTIKNFPVSALISYIRIPKTDYTKYVQLRVPGLGRGSLVDEVFEEVYRFIILPDFNYNKCSIWIKLNYN